MCRLLAAVSAFVRCAKADTWREIVQQRERKKLEGQERTGRAYHVTSPPPLIPVDDGDTYLHWTVNLQHVCRIYTLVSFLALDLAGLRLTSPAGIY